MRPIPAAFAVGCALACTALAAPAAAQQQAQPEDTATAVLPADAYADDAARDLVRRARIRRSMIDDRIVSYETRALERMSAGLRTPLGERLLFRRETASHVSWTRDTVHIHVLGAREVLPPVSALAQVPAGLTSAMPAIAFDPVDSEMLLRLDRTSLRHPLATGAEQYYRYALGDSAVVRLPDGREVRLRELRIVPRRADPRLITGSFWVDAETHAVVQAFFRLARGYQDRSAGVSVGGEVDYIAIEYGLWELRWWLPRIVAAQGMVRIGGVRVPLRFERRYDDYTVVGDAVALPTLAAAPADVAERLCRPRVAVTVQARVGGSGEADTVSAATRTRREAEAERERRARRAEPDSTTVCDRTFIVTREERDELLTSALLPADIYDAGSPILDDAELRAIAERLRRIPSPPWQLAPPVIETPLNRPALMRYNRVEGLSLGARALLDIGRLGVEAGARVGTAGGEIGAELGVDRRGEIVQSRIAAYRRLDAVDVATQPFGVHATLRALVLGSDDYDYFRANGVEVRVRPPEVRRQWFDVRLFAERQQAVEARAGFSLIGLADSDRVLRPNIAADPADQLGATLRLRTAAGLDPAGFRWGAELELHGETGDYSFVRPALQLRAGVPLGRRVSVGAEVAGGSAFGEPPVQRLWQIGGVSTLRGYDAAVARGDTYWRGRGELGYGLPFARFVAFSDVGWAGPRAGLGRGRALPAAGVGFSALDGLLRLDLARGLRTGGGWKLHLQFDGVL
jgi:hypothetical protein